MEIDSIEIFGAKEHNLKDFDVTIPKNKLVVFAGVSGSGKSSLVFDTLARESSRQWQDSYPLFLRNKLPHYERPHVDEIKNLPPSIVVDQKALRTNTRSTVGTAMDIAPLIRLLFSRVGQPSAGGSMAYSFNHPAGMCPICTGIGKVYQLIEDKIFDTTKSLNEGAINFSQFSSGWQAYLYKNNPLLDADKKLADFSEEEWQILREGSDEIVKVEFRSNNTGSVDRVDYEGVIPRFYRLYLKRDISKLKKSLQEEVLSLVIQVPCASCEGSGLNPKALASKINGHNIVDYMNLSVSELLPLLEEVDSPLGQSLVAQIKSAIKRMETVGIGYLSLSRKTETLSGGEMQRVKLVRHIGSSLSNVNYVFDEPTAGLHPHDAEKIGQLLLDLRDKHNNILVVEHSRQMLALADEVIELGPLAGREGGRLIFQGSLVELQKADTYTTRALNQPLRLNQDPLAWTEYFAIKDATANNLKQVNTKIPKGILTAVTGVAGSGKSSLIGVEFIENYPDAIIINQKPIGTSIRSTPATYLGIMDEIRKLFAKANNVTPSWFSYNSKGACPICKGTGKIVYDMAFADSVEVVCEECGGHRYNPKALSYRYQNFTIEEILNLTVEEALTVFSSNDKICQSLSVMKEVGLDYLTLGQPTSTLSGGEVQRVKLASKLQESGQIFVLDEPSTGLHGKDVEQLLSLLRRLVNQGNTVVMIEHRLELIAQADWIIDLGPEGGKNGGYILFEGKPRDIISCEESQTGKYLKEILNFS